MSLRINNRASRQNTLAGYIKAGANTDAQKTVLSKVFTPVSAVGVTLEAQSSTVSSTSATANAQIRLNSTPTALNQTNLTLTTGLNLNAASATVSSSNSGLTTSIRLTSSTAAESSSLANLSVAGGLSFEAISATVSTATTDLFTAIQLSGDSSATSQTTITNLNTQILLNIREQSGDTGFVKPNSIEVGTTGVAFSTSANNVLEEDGVTADVTLNNGGRSRHIKFPLRDLAIPKGSKITGLELSVFWGSTNSTSAGSMINTSIMNATVGSSTVNGATFIFGSTTTGVFEEQSTGLITPNDPGKYNYPGELTSDVATDKAISVYVTNSSGVSFRVYKIDNIKVRATYENSGQQSQSNLLTAITFAANSVAESLTTAEILVPSQQELSVTSGATSSTNANVSTDITLQANTNAVSSSSSSVQTQILLGGLQTSALATTSPTLTSAIRLVASSAATNSSAASAQTGISLNSATGIVNATSSNLSTGILLNAQGQSLQTNLTVAGLFTRQSINFTNGFVVFPDNTSYPITFQEYSNILVNSGDYAKIIVEGRL
jgi:hypothetical protein